MSLAQKIVKNTLFNVAGRFWGILVGLFLTPYIIRHIGVERFGIWAIVGVLIGCFGLLDFGVGTSFVKYISEFYTKKDYKKINHVVNTGLVFYFIFSIIIFLLAFFLINLLLTFFKIPEYLYGEALFVFIVGIILFTISVTLSTFVSIQTALQRMDITNKISIAVSIPMVIGTIFFLESGYGLPGLMVNNAVILGISSIINIIIAFKILPQLRFNPFLFSKKMFKKLFGFGYKLQVSKIASLLHFQTDKILLAHFLNIGFVAYYAVASQVAAVLKEIPLLLVSAIVPAASELDANKDSKTLSELYFRSMKYVVLIGLPVSLLIILLAEPFINLWLGKGYEKSVLTLQILVFGSFFNIITAPGFFILNGIGKPQYWMRSSIIAAVVNVIVSVFLVIKIGYFGVVIGMAGSMLIAACYFISKFHFVMNIPFQQIFLKIFLKPLFACGISFVIIYILVSQIGQFGWFSLIGTAAFYLILFAVVILKINYLDEFDKSLIKKAA